MRIRYDPDLIWDAAYDAKNRKSDCSIIAFVTQQWNNSGNEKKITSISGTVLKESIVDLRKVDKNMTDTSLPKGLKKGSGYNNFNSNTWKTIDINSRMDYESKDYTLKHQSVWENKLEASDESGKYELAKIDSWVKFASNYYYLLSNNELVWNICDAGLHVVLLFFLIIRAAKIVIDLARGNDLYTLYCSDRPYDWSAHQRGN